MKRLWPLSFLLLAVLFCPSCNGDEPDNLQPPSEQPEPPGDENNNPGSSDPAPGENGKFLVLFASRSGNTERMAQVIGSALDCNLLEVEPSDPYEGDYNAMLDRAQAEFEMIAEGSFPAIKTFVGDFSMYDIVFIGFPVWYNHIATPIQTFLHEHAGKLAGKRIALFATSGGSGITSSVNDARTLCPDAEFTEPLLLTSSGSSQTVTRVTQWLEQLGATREDNPNTPDDDTGDLKIRISVGGQAITATMEDNAAARDLISRLPLEVTLSDYNRTEKIFYPDPKLNIEGVEHGCAPVAGDITIYAPWGNVAIFYKDWPQSDALIKIGHIDGDGISVLSAYNGDVAVRMEKH